MNRTEFENRCQIKAWSQFVGDALLCQVLGDKFLYAHPQDASLTPWLAMTGYWESWISVAIANAVRPGMRCLDIGANVGYYTLLMAAQAGHENVTAVEPNPVLAGLLSRTMLANGYHNTTILESLVGAKNEAEVPIVVPDTLMGGASIYKLPGEGSTIYKCYQSTVDSIVQSSTVDLIKIDVEGAELDVWKGMQQTLDANPQLQVFMEITPCCHSENDLTDFFEDLDSREIPLRVVDYDGSIAPTSTISIKQSSDWLMLKLSKE